MRLEAKSAGLPGERWLGGSTNYHNTVRKVRWATGGRQDVRQITRNITFCIVSLPDLVFLSWLAVALRKGG